MEIFVIVTEKNAIKFGGFKKKLYLCTRIGCIKRTGRSLRPVIN